MEDEDKQPPHKGLKKGLYLIPTAFTAANIAMGFIAVLYSIRGFHLAFSDPSTASWYFDRAAIAIWLAILFDTLDGRVARMTRTATEIGVQFLQTYSRSELPRRRCCTVGRSGQRFPR